MGTQQETSVSAANYSDGGIKQLLIGGAFVDAKSGRTFESRNPATGALLAHVAQGDAEDIDLAVRSARAAFDDGPWATMKPTSSNSTTARSPASTLSTWDRRCCVRPEIFGARWG